MATSTGPQFQQSDAIESAPPPSSDSATDPATDPEKLAVATPRHGPSRARLQAQLVRKYDARVMPVVFLGLLLFWLDRTSIALARINGLEEDLQLHGAQFNIANMVFVLSYVVFSVPGNLLLRKVGGGRWLPLVVCAWGLVTLLSGFVTTFASLCVTRALLGVAEAGFMGAVLLYLGFFYTNNELTARVGIFFASTPLSGSVGGLLAAGLTRIRHPRLDRWPWIFIVEGALTILVGIGAFFVLPDTPRSAKFLTAEEQKIVVLREQQQARWQTLPRTGIATLGRHHPRVFDTINDIEMPVEGRASTGIPHDRLRLATFRRAVLHPITLLMTLGAFFTICALYSYSLFLPTIIATMGFGGDGEDNLRATLMTVPPNAVGAIFCIVATRWSQRTGTFAVPLITSSAMAFIGYLLLLVGSHVASTGEGVFDAVGHASAKAPTDDPTTQVLPALQYVGTFFVAMGVNALSPLAMAWVSLNASPHYIRAVSLGFVIMVGSLGGVVASFAYIKTAEPRYIAGHSINLAFCLGTILVGVAMVAWMRIENSRRDRGLRDGRLDASRRNGLTQEQYEVQLGWRHPRFRFQL